LLPSNVEGAPVASGDTLSAMDKDSKLLTYADVSARFAIKKATLYALVCQKRIPHVRIGRRFVRFVEDEIERWLAEKAVAALGSSDPKISV
jgi:excisionase family DNA binding protein